MSFKFVSATFLWVKAFASITKHYFSITGYKKICHFEKNLNNGTH